MADEFSSGIRGLRQQIAAKAKPAIGGADYKPEALVRFKGEDANLNNTLDVIQRALETLQGIRGQVLDHGVTYRGLQEELKEFLTLVEAKYTEVVAATDTVENANKLTTPRTIELSGDVTGSALFDGSADINIVTSNGASDRRLKDTIEIGNALSALRVWEPVMYRWNDLAKSLSYQFDHDQVEIGFTAQSIHETHPELAPLATFDVARDDDGLLREGESKSGEEYRTVNYQRTVPVITKAVQELDTKVTSVEVDVHAIKHTLIKLMDKVNKL